VAAGALWSSGHDTLVGTNWGRLGTTVGRPRIPNPHGASHRAPIIAQWSNATATEPQRTQTARKSQGLPLEVAGRLVAGLGAGVAIGIVSSLLGVAGGELIIPTLVLGFGADVKAAGTASLLISLPTILVGLWRQRRHAAAMTPVELQMCVLPMSGGSVLGAVLGGLLVEHVPGTFLKMLLGLVLMASALRVFAPADSSR
jgi:F0F1-type ATP synthase assembly protein I